MKYLSEAKELRKKVPISITEAISLLKENDRDLVLCEQIFKDNKVLEICQQTGCSAEMARQRFTELKFDITKAIHSIREELYDKQYKKPDFLTREKLKIIYEWLKLENFEGLDVALASKDIEIVIEVLQQMENMTLMYEALARAHERYNRYIEKYFENFGGNVEEYIKRTNSLRKDKVYNECRNIFEVNIETFERELERHDRNIAPNKRLGIWRTDLEIDINR